MRRSLIFVLLFLEIFSPYSAVVDAWSVFSPRPAQLDLWDANLQECVAVELADIGGKCSCPATDSDSIPPFQCKFGSWCDCSVLTGKKLLARRSGSEIFGICKPLAPRGESCSNPSQCLGGSCSSHLTSSRKLSNPMCIDENQQSCGSLDYSCGENLFCDGNVTCSPRKALDERCSVERELEAECRGGLACLAADGARRCRPLFAAGWDQPCSNAWGECSYGMECDAGRCAFFDANDLRNCTAGGAAACGPYRSARGFET
mmetsp:Transcript_38336/g.101743  ORF Transcript_38336/g.101743 Transcript_38336/m.101743 type:complete len:260 (+) Transcript_38336:50-829(+)